MARRLATTAARPLRALAPTDVTMLVLAAAAAEAGGSRAGVAPTPVATLLAFPLLVMALFAARGMYRPRLGIRVLDDFRAVLTTTALAAMVVLSARVFFGNDVAVADQMARLWAFAAAYVVGGRGLVYWLELRARRASRAAHPTLILGAGRVGRLTAKRLLENPELGLLPVGFLDKDPLLNGSALPLPVLGASWDLERVVREHGVTQVIVSFSTAPHEVLLRLCNRCEQLGVEVAFIPRFFERMTERLDIEHLGGLPLLFARKSDPRGSRFALKYAADRVVAAALLVLLAPVFLVAAAAVRLSVGSPVVFRQRRVGRDGRPFQMLKLRTMVGEPAESRPLDLPPDTAPGGVEGADRRTRVGELLRRTSLDELPQLVIVLRGEMSLVGPRPERPEFVSLFSDRVHRYDDRHRVKAGITGWAQVNGLRGKTSISDRAEWDNHYIENWSLWFDVKILLLTVGSVFRLFRTVE
ncbi:MAG TPA: sugar transferase [Gaiellaceae bacterium]|nr:sugar transferase [Gaiellaceae bacterium]